MTNKLCKKLFITCTWALRQEKKKRCICLVKAKKIVVFTAYKIFMLDHQMRLTFSMTADMDYV